MWRATPVFVPKTIYGSEKANRYLLETTGCGAAFFDYDHDGWLDIFLVNGSRFETAWTLPTLPLAGCIGTIAMARLQM